MKAEIILSSCLLYTNKETGELDTRLGYSFANDELRQNDDKMKGFPELSIFIPGTQVFNLLPLDIYHKKVTLVFEEQPSKRNPLQKVTVFKEIVYNGKVYSLL